MAQPLPARPDFGWLRKLSKDRLAALRASDGTAKLSDAQREVAREYGFPSWRKLKAHVETLRRQADAQAGSQAAATAPAAAPSVSAAAVPPAELVPPDDPDLTQLLAAAERGDTAAVAQILARRPRLIHGRGPQGQTPLHAAASSDDPRLAVVLLAYRPDPEAKYGASGHTALSWAVTIHSLRYARALVQFGCQPDLYCAAGIGSLPHVAACFDESGNLLPGASRTGSSRMAADGTRLPCPPPTAAEQVSDALYIACRTGQAEVARFLLGKGADVSFRAYCGGTPLHWAYFGGARAIVEVLLAAGADPAARDDVLHCTPRAFGICAPANWGFAHLVEDRLADDPTLANFMDGVTSPLHQAVLGGHVPIVKLLLAAGADPALRDGDGHTPLDLALERGLDGVVDSLRESNAQD